MVRRDALINKIRDLGYAFKSQQKRTYLWRQKNGTHYIHVPKADLLEDEFVTSVLRQAGVAEEDILSFLGAAKS